jgi:hypothetical protein
VQSYNTGTDLGQFEGEPHSPYAFGNGNVSAHRLHSPWRLAAPARLPMIAFPGFGSSEGIIDRSIPITVIFNNLHAALFPPRSGRRTNTSDLWERSNAVMHSEACANLPSSANWWLPFTSRYLRFLASCHGDPLAIAVVDDSEAIERTRHLLLP